MTSQPTASNRRLSFLSQPSFCNLLRNINVTGRWDDESPPSVSSFPKFSSEHGFLPQPPHLLQQYTATPSHLREVVVLVGGTATDVLGLRARDVDILEQNLHGRLGNSHGLSSSNLLVHVVAGLLVQLLEVLLR